LQRAKTLLRNRYNYSADDLFLPAGRRRSQRCLPIPGTQLSNVTDYSIQLAGGMAES
jgi:hypothetical protein